MSESNKPKFTDIDATVFWVPEDHLFGDAGSCINAFEEQAACGMVASHEYQLLFAKLERAEARIVLLRNALINCRMQFADMMGRVKAPDPWMIKELDEALAHDERGGDESL